MITTITFNPSIDKHYNLNDIVKGTVTRVKDVKNTAGGKGLNVSRVIKLLGEDVTATGFLGGKFGEYIEERLHKAGIKTKFQKIKGETRSCLAFITCDKCQTEILEPGPKIEDREIEKWFRIYNELLNESSIVCASGSLPEGVPLSIYSEIIKMAKQKSVKFLLDTSGDALSCGIRAKPFFIKPNLDELKAFAGSSIHRESDILKIIDKIHEMGVELIVVSLGKKGSIAGYEGKKYRIYIPEVNAVNPVGSGDSMVAGIAVALKRGYKIEDILSFASACGTANAMESETGFINIDNVNMLKDMIKVVTI